MPKWSMGTVILRRNGLASRQVLVHNTQIEVMGASGNITSVVETTSGVSVPRMY